MAYDSTLASETGQVCRGLLGKPWDVISVCPHGEECGSACYWQLAYSHVRDEPEDEVAPCAQQRWDSLGPGQL